jgi:hypothetical protein
MTVPQVDIAAAIEITQERERQADIDRRIERMASMAVADCIASGLCGIALSSALHNRFPTTPRAEVYMGIGLALALLQTDLTIARMELDLIRNGGPPA